MKAARRRLGEAVLRCGCVEWSCWHGWRVWCKPAMAAFYLMFVMLALPLLVYKLLTVENPATMATKFVAGIFVLCTLPVFLVGMMHHIFNYTKPHLQKHIIRLVATCAGPKNQPLVTVLLSFSGFFGLCPFTLSTV